MWTGDYDFFPRCHDVLLVICYKYYNPKKKSPDDEKKIPPETGVGVDVLLANTTTLSDWTLNISTLDDCIKNKLELTFTEAVIDPVEIWYKFNPTTADTGILNKLAPEPE